MFVTYCTIIMEILRTLLHIPFAKWHFLHYWHLLDPIQWKIRHIRNTRYIFLYQDCKLVCIWLTVNFHLVNSLMYTDLWGTLRFVWRQVSAQDVDYCKNVHTGVWPLIFQVVLILEDKLTYQPLPCNSIHIFFLDYIRLHAVMVIQRESLLL